MNERSAITSTIVSIAAEQGGVVSRRQLLEAGLSSGVVGRRRKSSWLLPVCPGVYAVGRPISGDEGIWTAGVLAGGSGTFLARHCAAALWASSNGMARSRSFARKAEILRGLCWDGPASRPSVHSRSGEAGTLILLTRLPAVEFRSPRLPERFLIWPGAKARGSFGRCSMKPIAGGCCPKWR